MHRIFAICLVAAALAAQSVLTLTTLLQPQVISFLQEAVTGRWHNAKNQGIVAFVCYTDTSALFRALSRTSSVQIPMYYNWYKTLAKIIATGQNEHLTCIVDLQCPSVDDLLSQAKEAGFLKIPNRWLLLNITQQPDSITDTAPILRDGSEDSVACRDMAVFLGKSSPGFEGTTATDSDVILVCGMAGNNAVLVDMWGATALGFWWPGKRFRGDQRPPSARRIAVGIHGRAFRVAMVIQRNDSLKHMDDGIDTRHDTLTKFNWEVIHNIVKMLNGSLAIFTSNSYGYNINGTWSGMIGMQVRGEAEMSGTSIAMVQNRLSVIKYTNFPLPAKGIFIFRAPPMSYEHNLFTQPFSVSLWFAAIGLILVCAILLYGTLKAEELAGIEEKPAVSGIPIQIISEGRKRRLEATWSDVVLLAFGAVCQQGSPVEARGLTGRIITIFLFIGIVFLYTSYSAAIVSLLQSTSTSIRTYKDLLHSKIALGAESVDFNIYYMKNLDDPLRKKMYEKKIKKNILTLEEGMKKVRRSYFAFHTMRSYIYKEIADTYQESEKCGLIEIEHFLSLQDPMIVVSNWSEHTELIMISLRKNHERGIRNRQIQRFLTRKPQCINQGGNFQSVALIDTEAAFVVLGMGYGISSLLLLIEKFVFRYQKA